MINLRIVNTTLLVSNLSLLEGKKTTRLIADSPAASGTLSVANISGFAINNVLLDGNFGDSSSELLKTHTSTAPSGTTITLAANTVRDHYSDTAITVLDYDQVEYSRATTLTGSKSVLATQNLNPDLLESFYKDATNTTGYGFVRFKNSITGTFSDYSTGVNYTGLGSTTVSDIVNKACEDVLVEVGGQFSGEQTLLNDANDCQDAILDEDWKFELVKNDSSLTATQYENTYSLSGLTYELKYPGISQGIKSVKLSGQRLDLIDNDEMDTNYADVVRAEVSTEAAIAATSLVLTNSSELPDVGTIYVNGMDIVYTANNTTTNTLSGIPSGDITAIIAAGSIAWYRIVPGLPTKYTITIDNEIIFNVPIDTGYHGYSITIEYLKKLTRFTDFASTTDIPFTDAMPLFISAKIEKRKRNMENYATFMAEFTNSISKKKDQYKMPVMENSTYYNF